MAEKRSGESYEELDDVARGSSLQFANKQYPGAFAPHVRYVSMCGKAIKGCQLRDLFQGNGDIASVVAFNSYKANYGEGGVWGDGVTPLQSARLEGSEWVVLDGVRHTPAKQESNALWYGDAPVVEQLLDYLA